MRICREARAGSPSQSYIGAPRIIHEMNQFPNPDFATAKASFSPNSPYVYEWSLRPVWRVALFLLPLIAGAVWLGRQAIRIAQVTYQVNTVSVTDIQKAIDKDPGNADLIHRLGVVYSTSPADIDLTEAVKNLHKAAALNPRRWDYWLDLGTSCDFAGDTQCSDAAFMRALELNPMSPSMQWTLANHYILTNREQQAFPYFRRVLEMDPNYLGPTFRLCFRAIRDPQTIYAEVVPRGKDPSGRFAFLMFLSSAADYENAMRIWGQMISGPDRSPDTSMVKPFLDFLIDHNQLQNAYTVWTDLQHAGVIPLESPSPDGNLLYDGSFEGQPLNTGFDWRAIDSPELVFDFSDRSAYKGARCLRIDFAVGRNANFDLVNQVVLVKPNTRYQAAAFVRSDNLTSESGPQLRVLEMGCGGCIPQTSDPVTGTTDWHSIDVTFMTQPQTQAVRISLWRPKDNRYHSDITGRVWLDDVTLRSLEVPQPDVSQARPR